jgi:hypothetical protein
MRQNWPPSISSAYTSNTLLNETRLSYPCLGLWFPDLSRFGYGFAFSEIFASEVGKFDFFSNENPLLFTVSVSICEQFLC